MVRAPGRRGGRPRLDPAAPSIPLSVRVTPTAYDALYARARAERLTLAAFVRETLSKLPTRAPKI